MKIQDFIKENHVFLGLEARDLVQALKVVADCAAPQIGLESKAVVQELLEREKLGSTSVGDGFAIPHCKIANLKNIAVFLARFADPVDFGAADEHTVKFFFVVLSPPDQPAAHLQVLSQIARVLKRSELRGKLIDAPDPLDVIRVFQGAADAEGM